jgi:hypothetical protein
MQLKINRMSNAPYTLQEAEQLCKEYQYLVGQKFSSDSDLFIECVTITPFDEINKKRFLILYFLFNNAESALSHEYKGFLFDIIVIGRSQQDQHELLQEDLSVWLAENKTHFAAIRKSHGQLSQSKLTNKGN